MRILDRIKSWQIALVGIVLQTTFGLMLFLSGADLTGFSGVILIIGGYVFLLSAMIGVIPIILLFFEATRKYGAALSIVFGIIGIVIGIGTIVGVFLIVAGILHIWKKI